MFGITLQGKIGGLTSVVKIDNGQKIRRDHLKVHFEFTEKTAKAMDLLGLHDDLDDGSLSSATKSLEGELTLSADDGSEKTDLETYSARLTFKRVYKDDASPKMTLDAVLPFREATHMWLVNRLEETVDWRATLEPTQMDLESGDGDG